MCHFCPQRFRRKDHLGRHLKAAHSTDGSLHSKKEPKQKLHGCDICDRKFATKQDLKRHHMTVHSKETPHKCTECPEGFGRRDKLVKHMRDKHFITLPKAQHTRGKLKKEKTFSKGRRKKPACFRKESKSSSTAFTSIKGVSHSDLANQVIAPVSIVPGNSQSMQPNQNTGILLEHQYSSLNHPNILADLLPSLQVNISTGDVISSDVASSNVTANQIIVQTLSNYNPLTNVDSSHLQQDFTFSNQNVSNHEAIPACPIFPETKVSDVTQILNEVSKVTPSVPFKKASRRVKKQRSKVSKQPKLSKDSTVLIKDLPVQQPDFGETQTLNNSTMLTSNVVALQDQVSNSSFQIPCFGSSFDNITFSEKSKPSKTDQEAVDKSDNLAAATSLLGLQQSTTDPFSSLLNKNTQVTQMNQSEHYQQQSFILPVSDGGTDIYTSQTGLQNFQNIQLVNLNEISDVNEIALTAADKLEASSQAVSQKESTVDNVLTATVSSQRPPLRQHDSESIKIFFGDEQQHI